MAGRRVKVPVPGGQEEREPCLSVQRSPAPVSLFMTYSPRPPPDCPGTRSLPALPSWLRWSLGPSSWGGVAESLREPLRLGSGCASLGCQPAPYGSPVGGRKAPGVLWNPPPPGPTASAVSSPGRRCSAVGVFKFSENHCLSVPCARCGSQAAGHPGTAALPPPGLGPTPPPAWAGGGRVRCDHQRAPQPRHPAGGWRFWFLVVFFFFDTCVWLPDPHPSAHFPESWQRVLRVGSALQRWLRLRPSWSSPTLPTFPTFLSGSGMRWRESEQAPFQVALGRSGQTRWALCVRFCI